MDSRMERYEEVNIDNYQRSKKNAGLYKEVYGNYADFEDLPIPENTNEIDIENFKSLVGSRIDRKKERIEDNFNVEEEKIEVIKEENKVYDINELLEKAKVENAKIKKEVVVNKNIPNYLANLESDKNTKDIISKYENDDDDLPIIKTTEYTTNIINVKTDNLSLDILSDLKPSGDTFVSEPINDNEEKQEEKEFYSGKINFSESDFNIGEENDDEEFYEESNHSFLKIILIVVIISSLITAGYFVLHEMGIIKF